MEDLQMQHNDLKKQIQVPWKQLPQPNPPTSLDQSRVESNSTPPDKLD